MPPNPPEEPGCRIAGEAEGDGEGPGVRADCVDPPQRADGHFAAAAAALAGGARHAEHLGQEGREGAGARQRVLEELEDLALLALLLVVPVGLRDLGWLELEPQILVGRPRSRRQRLLSQEPARPDLAEPVGRIGHRFPARGDFQ